MKTCSGLKLSHCFKKTVFLFVDLMAGALGRTSQRLLQLFYRPGGHLHIEWGGVAMECRIGVVGESWWDRGIFREGEA